MAKLVIILGMVGDFWYLLKLKYSYGNYYMGEFSLMSTIMHTTRGFPPTSYVAFSGRLLNTKFGDAMDVRNVGSY